LYFDTAGNSYLDILHSNKKPFYHCGSDEDSSAMDAYLMHSLNHIFKTRDLVKKNESKIAKHRETSEEEILSDDGFLDQGFTRPKVLILLPLRSIAFRVVKRLIQLTPESQRVYKFMKFVHQFFNWKMLCDCVASTLHLVDEKIL
jgi:U3 small nucleolar RNA-associated protein 25